MARMGDRIRQRFQYTCRTIDRVFDCGERGIWGVGRFQVNGALPDLKFDNTKIASVLFCGC